MARLQQGRDEEDSVRETREDDSGHRNALHGASRLCEIFQVGQGRHYLPIMCKDIQDRNIQIQLQLQQSLRVLHPDLLVVRDDLLKGILR